jgi:prepilin-type N-terminal cleavage/methylation domain-containing protein
MVSNRKFQTTDRFDNRGFTLIEIMVVIVLIGILALLTVDGSLGYMKRADSVKSKVNMQSVADRLELYHRTTPTAVGSSYPPSSISLDNFRSIVGDDSLISAPGTNNITMQIAQGSTTPSSINGTMNYLYYSQNVDGSLCTATPCVRYTLYYWSPVDNALEQINSLRQQ